MMSLKIIEHKKNALMGRDEVKAMYEHHGKPTPTREQILPSLESVLKMSGEHIIIERIFTTKGRGESLVKALVYEEKAKMPQHKMDVIEKRKLKKNTKKEGADAGAAKK